MLHNNSFLGECQYTLFTEELFRIYSDATDLVKNDPAAFRAKELEMLEKNITNVNRHLIFSLTHLSKGRRKQVVVFLDNADQRDDVFQQELFLIAQELAERWPVTVFLSLRPETFHRSMRHGVLGAYHPKAFTISPPRVDLVVKKRLAFAAKIASGEIALTSLSAGIQVRLQKLHEVLRVFLVSMDKNEDLVEFLDNISGGNVRNALNYVNQFLGSGHVDTKKILEISATGEYVVPLHEFVGAVIHGDSQFYHPDQSPITNIFDLSTLDPREHFLMAIIITILASSTNKKREGGFVDAETLYKHVQSLGFTPPQIDSCLSRSLNRRLIESNIKESIMAAEDYLLFRPTTIGLYHVDRLCKTFTYIDAVVVDTPILAEKVRLEIMSVREIEQRLRRAELFVGYLDACWKEISGSSAAFDWPLASAMVAKDIETVRWRVQRRASLNPH